MIYDLHCHSNKSDGVLSPADVVRRARAMGVDVLALTDHDTLAGLSEAMACADTEGVRLVPGVEISVSWGQRVFHVVGLNVNPGNEQLVSGLAGLAAQRQQRARDIGERLHKCGIGQAYDEAERLAAGGNVTRTHFARVVVAAGKAKNQADAFAKYLAQGKKAYVKTRWAELGDAISWINQAGGVAVLAHPARYKMSKTLMRAFLSDFTAAGGRGIEVVNGGVSRDMVQQNISWANQYDLLVSVGSDFHSPEFAWTELGRLAPLPENVTPVWQHWEKI